MRIGSLCSGVDPKAALAECRAELEQAKQAKGAA